MREYGASMPRLDRFPAYEALLTDAAGRVWVRDYVREYEDDGWRRWTVFSADGREVVSRVSHSSSFRPLEIAEGSVLGVQTDELGVERVVARELVTEADRNSS
jgi:hypothetical protein